MFPLWPAYTCGEEMSTHNHQDRRESTGARESAPHPLLLPLLGEIVRQPQRLLAVWNWKSALLSICLRGPIFFSAAISRGLHAAITAVSLEAIVCAFGVGLYNALVQLLRGARPLWATGVLLSVVLPGCVQAVEYTAHRLRGTAHLRTAAVLSLCVSALSTLFNWYAMQRGALMVGAGTSTLLDDMRQLPRLIAGFLLQPLRWIRSRSSTAPFAAR